MTTEPTIVYEDPAQTVYELEKARAIVRGTSVGWIVTIDTTEYAPQRFRVDAEFLAAQELIAGAKKTQTSDQERLKKIARLVELTMVLEELVKQEGIVLTPSEEGRLALARSIKHLLED